MDRTDGSIYRVVERPGQAPFEEYILCTDRSASRFKCILDDDLKKQIEYFRTKCTCQE